MPGTADSLLLSASPRQPVRATRSSRAELILCSAIFLALAGPAELAREYLDQRPPTPSPPRFKGRIPQEELLLLEPHNFAGVLESLATPQHQASQAGKLLAIQPEGLASLGMTACHASIRPDQMYKGLESLHGCNSRSVTAAA